MKPCNNYKQKRHQNNKPRQPKNLPINDALPLPIPAKVEIHVPSKDEFVKIPIDEYAELVAATSTLGAIARWVESDPGTYVNFSVLRALLAIPEEDDKK